MKILLVDNHEDGVYKCRGELIRRLLQEHEVVISLPRGKYTDEMVSWGCQFEDVEIDRRGTNPLNEIILIKYYRNLLKKVQPDVVLTYSIKPNSYMGWLCGKQKIPFIANITGLGSAILNGGIVGKISLAIYRFGLRKAQMVFFQNQANLEFMKAHKAIHSPCTVIPGSGVNLDTHCFEPYPSDAENVSFLTIGRLMKDKGTDELLEAARIIRSEHPEVSFHLIGFYDGEYQEKIETAQKEGVLVFHGHQDDVHSFVKRSHAIIHPSYHEGMANALLESASAGRPVLASKIPGCEETFEDGVTGIGFEARNAQALVVAIRKFLAMNHEEQAEMGRAAREKMEKEFDRNIVISKYLEQLNVISN